MVSILRYDEADVLRRLSPLSTTLRVAFALSCATRILPAYFNFSQQAGRGDPGWVRLTANSLWKDLQGIGNMTMQDLEIAAVRCKDLGPEEDQLPWLPSQAWAEDAVAALAYALRCRRTGRAQESAWASRRAYEAIDNFVMSEETVAIVSTETELHVLSHPLVQAELGRQTRDLDELLAANDACVVDIVTKIEKRSIVESYGFSLHS